MARIKWVNEAPNDPENRGNWHSLEGRFSITPEYCGRTTPQQYRVRDYLKRSEPAKIYDDCAFDTVRRCKEWAEGRLI